MGRYAEKTLVSTYKSKIEIEKTITRYGADQFLTGWDDKGESLKAVVSFKMNNRFIKFLIDMPSKDDPQFKQTPSGNRERTPEKTLEAWEQSCRQRWRALYLVIKAKLEAVDSGITEFESEFMAHILLPNGQTVGQYMIPQISKVYETKKMPELLPDLRKV